MKKIHILALLALILLASCKQNTRVKEEQLGHWVSAEYLGEIDNGKMPHETSLPPIELIFEKDDSNYTYFFIGKSKFEGKYMPNEEGKLIAKNFAKSGQDWQFNFSDSCLYIENALDGKKFKYEKVNMDQIQESGEASQFQSYLIPLINKKIIAGSYQSGSDTIQFANSGIVKGHPQFVSYSLCYTKDCLNASESATIFLAEKGNTGKFYDLEKRADSLFIYNVSEYDLQRGMKSKRENLKLLLVKIK
jgi:hypothetical protein